MGVLVFSEVEANQWAKSQIDNIEANLVQTNKLVQYLQKDKIYQR